jgi:hypothetical protein
MNRILLLLIFVVSSLSLSAQYLQGPDSINIVTVSTTEEVSRDAVYNAGVDSSTVYWKLEKAPSFHSEWEFFVCDLNLCYNSNTERCPPNKPNLMTASGSTLIFHFKPNGVYGTSIVIVRYYSDKNFTQEVFSTQININVTEGVSSTKDLSGLNNLKVYPNPATDYFQISNTVGVKKIVVYNMFGKEVKSYFHYPNAQHEISELKTGMYIVKLINDKNKVVKSVKLNKVHSGV